MGLTFEQLRIIIEDYYPQKPDETNYLEFMGEDFLKKNFELFLKNGVSSFKDLTTKISGISLPGLPGLPSGPDFSIGGIGGTPDPSFYDNTEQGINRRSLKPNRDKDKISEQSNSQRISNYNNIKNNPSNGNIYNPKFIDKSSYIYYDDLLRRLYMIEDYVFNKN